MTPEVVVGDLPDDQWDAIKRRAAIEVALGIQPGRIWLERLINQEGEAAALAQLMEEPMEDDQAVITREDPDFTVAGTSLLEWLGHEPHDATIKAAEQAIAVPGEAFMVAVFREPSLPADRFGEQQRRALRVWQKKVHPDLPGRLRLNVRTQLEPDTGQDLRVAVVTYDAKPRAKKASSD